MTGAAAALYVRRRARRVVAAVAQGQIVTAIGRKVQPCAADALDHGKLIASQ